MATRGSGDRPAHDGREGEGVHRLHEGFVLGARYRLARRVASGGMGDVWEGVDDVLGRTVAVKVMRPDAAAEEVFVDRFRAEARHAASLHHPTIATVFDYGEQDGLAFLVMEFVSGQALSAVLRRDGPLPPDLVRSVLGQAALALAVAHEAGVVHRDVKPGNLLLADDGSVKLTDFGIARAVDSAGHTRTGEVLGTPYYLSPEQALGKPATGASDLYSLGVLAHEMLTGSKPFDKGTPLATALSHLSEAPPPLPDGVPDDLARAIEACLAKDPEARPVSARELAAAVGVGVESTPPDESPAAEVEGAAEVQERQAEYAADLAPHSPPEPALDGPDEATRAWRPEWTSPMPVLELEQVLGRMSPTRRSGVWVWALVDAPDPARPSGAVGAALPAVVTVCDGDQTSVLLRREDADAAGVDHGAELAWISVRVGTSLATEGLLSALVLALAQAGIACQVVSTAREDHLLVEIDKAERALGVLTRLAAAHRL